MTYTAWFAAASLMFGVGYITGNRILWLKRLYELA
jgi:hypothetical protein